MSGGSTRAPLYTRRPVLAGVLRQWPLGVVIAAVGVGLLLVALDLWRRGLVVIGVAMLGAALLRLVLPTRRAGFLAVRGRLSDVVVCASAGAALTTIALLIPPG